MEDIEKVCLSCFEKLSKMPTTIPGLDELFKYCANNKCYRFGLVTTLVRAEKNVNYESKDEVKEQENGTV